MYVEYAAGRGNSEIPTERCPKREAGRECRDAWVSTGKNPARAYLWSDLWKRSRANLGASRVPEMRMGTTEPAPSFLKKGSASLRKKDFLPVTVCESLACMRRLPRKSRVSSGRRYLPVRRTSAPGMRKLRRGKEATSCRSEE